MADLLKFIKRTTATVLARTPLRRTVIRQLDASEIRDSWRNPSARHAQENYVAGEARTRLIIDALSRHVEPCSVLEVGCGPGRNLAALQAAGFSPLTGIDIAPDAKRVMSETYPDLQVDLHIGPLEDVLPGLPPHDVVLCAGILMIVPGEEALDMVAEKAQRFIVTVENERFYSKEHFPRDYKRAFGQRGFVQVESQSAGGIDGLPRGWHLRVLKRTSY